MNNEKTRLLAYMGIAISVLAFFSALAGVLNEDIYKEVYLSGAIAERLVWGSIAQDCISVPLSVILFVLAIMQIIAPSESGLIAAMGLEGYFFYAYGLYVIQGQYTSLYMIYMIIFALSIYSLIFGIAGFEKKRLEGKCFPRNFRVSVSAFMLMILMVLGPLWVVLMLTDMTIRFPGETYGVFILDLCIVFPALGVALVGFYRKSTFGTLLAGVGLVKILTVCMSVAFAEWFVSYLSGGIPDGFMFAMFTALSGISLLLLVKYFEFLRKKVSA